MAQAIPRGIQPVEWTRKDGSKGVRYRVRIKRKTLNFSALFEDLDTAIEALNNSKTELGRTALSDFLHAEEDKKKNLHVFSEAVSDSLSAHLLSFYVEHFQASEDNEIDKKNNSIYLNIVNTLSNTLIQDQTEFEAWPPLMRVQMKFPPTKKFGDLDPFKIQARDVTAYINARLETAKRNKAGTITGYIKKSTITKELSFLSSFFNSYHSYAGDKYGSLALNNPVKVANKRKLKGAFVKRDRRLSEDEENALFNALQKCRNKDMLAIFQLAICSGMRRSEILFLEWRQIDFDREFIKLERTKNGEPIRIQMLPEAWDYLKLVKRKPKTERLFTYTLDGFKSNFARVLVWSKIEGYTFRDLRSEFISRGLSMGLSKFVVTAMLSIRNQASFDRTHLKQHEEEERLNRPLKSKDIQGQVNHKAANMTNHYNRLNLKQALKDGDLDR